MVLLKAVLGTRHCQNPPPPVNPKPQPRDGSPLIHDQNAQTQTFLNLNLRTRYIVASRFGAGPGLRIVLGEGVVGVGKGGAIGAFPDFASNGGQSEVPRSDRKFISLRGHVYLQIVQGCG